VNTRSLAAAVLVMMGSACAPPQSAAPAKNVMVLGIDVSGSFRARHYDDAIDFAAYYIYGHMKGLGGLRQPSAVFVGSVGGDLAEEVKSFHPIHDFEGKDVEQIRQDLREWFPPTDRMTDYNAFFDRIASLIKRQNLVLAPLNIVVLTDGVPDFRRAARRDSTSAYAAIKVDALEYLSRNVTIRLLYPTPTVAVGWERGLKRDRVRLWTLDAQVMEGWRAQMAAGQPPEGQAKLWRWMEDNVDFRVRSSIL
jgi:hypothetical protein